MLINKPTDFTNENLLMTLIMLISQTSGIDGQEATGVVDYSLEL